MDSTTYQSPKFWWRYASALTSYLVIGWSDGSKSSGVPVLIPAPGALIPKFEQDFDLTYLQVGAAGVEAYLGVFHIHCDLCRIPHRYLRQRALVPSAGLAYRPKWWSLRTGIKRWTTQGVHSASRDGVDNGRGLSDAHGLLHRPVSEATLKSDPQGKPAALLRHSYLCMGWRHRPSGHHCPDVRYSSVAS